MSLSQFRSRSRAYQCRKCAKIDRKGRVMGHILKHHVPFDRVPFSCSLCLFRCQEKQSLVDHLKKYSRHREEEARCGVPDYAKFLKKSSDPYNVEEDMIQLTREESLRWHARNSLPENPMDDSDGRFEEEDEETVVSDGRALPRWLVNPAAPLISKPQSIGYQPHTILSTQPNFTSALGQYQVAPAQQSHFAIAPMEYQAPPIQQPTLVPALAQHQMTPTRHTVSSASAQHQMTPFQQPTFTSALAQHQDQVTITKQPTLASLQHQGTSASAQPLATGVTRSQIPCTSTYTIPAYGLDLPTANASPSNQQVTQLDTINFNGLLNSSILDKLTTTAQSSPSQKTSISTPCLDKNVTNILPRLMIPEAEQNDPLLQDVETNNHDNQPPTKKQKSDNSPSNTPEPETQPQHGNWVQDIVKAIQEGTTLITNAVQANALAVRNNARAMEKVSEELGRMERKLHFMEKAILQTKSGDKENKDKENKAPQKKTLKSVVVNKQH